MPDMERLESEIREWRSFVEASPAVDGRDVDELEDHLRGQVDDLLAVGLAPDEALLIAVKRLGSIDELSREYAEEHSRRLWRQLIESGGDGEQKSDTGWVEMLAFAVAAAITIQVVRLIAGFPEEAPSWILTNASLFVLPFLAGYLAQRRGLDAREMLITASPFVFAALVINLYPFEHGGSTQILAAAHLAVALWFAIAYPYSGAALRSRERRMDFVRFSGEWFIYMVLIALGGGVLVALTSFILEPTGTIDRQHVFEWIVPSGAAGAIVVAAWLVESKQRVVENMAPVLTMIFTPLFALMLVVATVVYAGTGLGGVFDRDLLGVFDAVLVVVFGLVLYSTSARDPSLPPGWNDRAQLVAVLGALVLDAMVLATMVARIGDLGFTPNRTAALGLNLVLLVGLAGSAWLSIRFVVRRAPFHSLERWQTAYLPVLALWATTVVVILPPLFSFI